MARAIDLIVIHCSDSPNGRSLFSGKAGEKGFVTPVQEIDRWHRERGFKRSPVCRAAQNPDLTSIGYHFVIYTNGAVASGRHQGEIGAHAQGSNANSIGICLIGCNAFTIAQWLSLKDLVEGLRKKNPTARVSGHHELNPAKTCPNFNVQAWLETGMQPPVGQITREPT